MKRLITPVLIILSGIFIFPGFSLSAAEAPSDLITRDCGMYLEVKNADTLIKAVGDYARGFGLPIKTEKLRKNLSRTLFGTDDMAGIDTTRPAAIMLYFYNGQVQQEPGGILYLPVRDKNSFQSNPRIKSMLKGKSMVKMLDDYAVIATDPKAYEAFQSGRKKNVKLLEDTQVSFYMDMVMFRPIIKKFLQQMQQTAMNRKDSSSKVMSSIFAMYQDMLLQIESYQFGLKLDEQGLEGSILARYLKGSDYAEVLSASENGELKNISHLPADSVMVSAARVQWENYVKVYSDILDTFKDYDPQFVKALQAILQDMGKIQGDNMAMAMLPCQQPGLSFAVIQDIRSKSKFRANIQKSFQALRDSKIIKKVPEGMNLEIEYKKDTASNMGISIDSAKLTFTIPEKEKKRMSAQERVMVSNIRDLFQVRIAFIDGKALITMGNEADLKIRELIAVAKKQKKNFTSTQAWKGMERIYGSKKKNGYYHVSLVKSIEELVTWAAFISREDDMKQIQAILKQIPPSSPSVFGYTQIKGRDLEVRTMLSAADIKNIFRLVSSMMQKKQQPNR